MIVDQLTAGSVLGERYRLVGPAAGASMGTVWRAVDDVTMREVIVKALGAYPAGDQTAWERARLALRVITGLQHPGVAQVYDYLQATGPADAAVPCLVRELVHGQTLEERLASGPLEVSEALTIAGSVAGILAAVHQTGLVHGNLVPANVVLGSGGVRLTDVGLWVLRDHPAVDVFPDALSYAAPERASGGPATPATDMYALGVMFAACLSGIAAGGSAGAAARADLPGDAAAADLASVWAACLALDPQDRPSAAHAAAMSQQLLTAGPRAPAARTAQIIPDLPQVVPPAAGEQAAAVAAMPPPPPGRRETRQRQTGGKRRPGSLRPPGRRPGRLGPARRGALLALGGAATGVTVAVVAVLGQFVPAAPAPSPRPAAASSAPARLGTGTAMATFTHHARPGSPRPDASMAVTSSAPAPDPSPAQQAMTALAAINQLWAAIQQGGAGGQIRQDVVVDFSNLIQPVRSELIAGQPAQPGQIGQLVTTLRSKLAARVSEGAVSTGIASVISSDLNQLASSI